MYCTGDALGSQRLNCILKALRHINASHLLDVGCAEGFYLRLFRSLNPRCFGVGIDISLSYIIKAKKKAPEEEYVLADIEYLPFRDSFFDVVLCSEVLEHVFAPKTAFSELVRVSKRFAIITTPSHTLPYYLAERLSFVRQLALRKGFLSCNDAFKTLGPGGGHISLIEVTQMESWALEVRCRVVEARVLYTVGAPVKLPRSLWSLINTLVDGFVNLLPLEKRKGAIHFVLIEKNLDSERNE